MVVFFSILIRFKQRADRDILILNLLYGSEDSRQASQDLISLVHFPSPRLRNDLPKGGTAASQDGKPRRIARQSNTLPFRRYPARCRIRSTEAYPNSRSTNNVCIRAYCHAKMQTKLINNALYSTAFGIIDKR